MNYTMPLSFAPPPVQSMQLSFVPPPVQLAPQVVSAPQYQPQFTSQPAISQS